MMKSIKELQDAIFKNAQLIWNDPDPIPGNDYTINFIEQLNEKDFDLFTPILINYGAGSEAQVYLKEIIYK